jgi:hypothetical protein
LQAEPTLRTPHDHAGAGVLGELHGEMADAAGGACNQRCLPWFEAAAVEQRLPRGHPGHGQGRRLRVAQAPMEAPLMTSSLIGFMSLTISQLREPSSGVLRYVVISPHGLTSVRTSSLAWRNRPRACT